MRLLFLLAVTGIGLVASMTGAAGDAALGQKIYRDGILPSGQALRAVSLQGVNLRGERAACTTCHRRSGFGSSEGYKPIRPIAGRYLFQAVNAPNPRLSSDPASPNRGMRPAYDERTLARVLRTGIDAAGRKLDAMMPRYQLDDANIDHLATYLKTLSIEPDPGVTATTIHFATIVDTAADPEQRQAMLGIIETFFRDKNAGTRLEGERARRAPWDMAREYKAYRKWQLHVWALEGPPETWRAQLEAYYRAQPVFAVLSGIGAGTWQPVHDFCERTKVPCLFPNVDQPPQTPGQYTLYLSRGLAMEAEALAAHLARSRTMGRIVQVYRDGTTGAAGAFDRALKAADLPPPETRKVISAAPPDAGFWREIVKAQPDVLVLWLKSEDLAALDSLPQSVRQIFLSARLADLPALPPPLAERAALVYPWELPQRLAPRLQRLHAWLKMKRISPRDDTIQADTFFAVSQAGMEIQHLVDDYSRDYFIERVEHGLDNALAPSSYPSPTLAPGQRYASKGSYIVKAAGNGRQQLEPVGDWIVPDLLPGAPRQ
jgi:hypothetical protein